MLKRVRSLLAAEKEAARLQADLEKARARIRRLQKRLPEHAVTLTPESLVWIFGGGRTGSSWLSAMMGDMPDHAVWFEPMLGELFDPERLQVGVRGGRSFVFAQYHKETWLAAVRNFVLDTAGARFPEGPEILVIKEPHGSAGAPMLSEALPESRVVLLVRDPRDVVASALDRYLNGPWQGTGGWGMYRGPETTPDGFAERAARSYLRHATAAKRALDDHRGPKALVRYEALRADALGEMRRLYAELSIPAKDEDLVRAVEEHAFEDVPREEKGPGKRARKAAPGAWEEDLTPDQTRMVEEITAPLLREFYRDA